MFSFHCTAFVFFVVVIAMGWLTVTGTFFVGGVLSLAFLWPRDQRKCQWILFSNTQLHSSRWQSADPSVRNESCNMLRKYAKIKSRKPWQLLHGLFLHYRTQHCLDDRQSLLGKSNEFPWAETMFTSVSQCVEATVTRARYRWFKTPPKGEQLSCRVTEVISCGDWRLFSEVS